MKKNRKQLAKETAKLAVFAGLITGLTVSTAAYGLAGGAEVQAVPKIDIEAAEIPQAEKLQIRTYYNVPLSDDLQDHIALLCEKHHIDPAIVTAMIYRESTYRASVMGDGGKSYGLMQVQKRWHGERMDRLSVDDLLDPFQNVTVGIDILSDLIDSYDGNVEKALVAYNMGASGAYKNLFSKGIYSSKYSRAVLSKAEELRKDVTIVFYTDDPVRDFESYDREQAKKMHELPVCADCDEPIQDSTCYEINGEYICHDCMESLHQKDVRDCV